MWYYSKSGQQLGPVSEAQLRQLVAQGDVTTADLVWREGMPQWQPLSSVIVPNGTPQGEIQGVPHPGPTRAPGEVNYYNPLHHTHTGYVGSWWRFPAIVMDSVLLGLVSCFLIQLPFGLLLNAMGTTDPDSDGPTSPAEIVAIILMYAMSIVVPWLYEAWMVTRYGATLGKMAIGVKVARPDGSPLSFARASGRHFAKYLSYITLYIGFIMAAFTQKKQGLHDMICDTVVIRTR